jgi:hypothetical protein
LGRLLVASNVNSGPDTVFAIDVATGTIVSRLPVPGGTPRSLKRSPATGLFYYAASHDSVSVVSSDGLRVIANLGVGNAPSGLAFAPPQHRVYVSHDGSDKVYVLRDTVGVPGVAETPGAGVPGGLSVEPNPVRRSATIHFQLPGGGAVRIDVYSQDGRLVRVLSAKGTGRAGESAVWDGCDAKGRRLAAGVYVCALQGGGHRLNRKVVLTE